MKDLLACPLSSRFARLCGVLRLTAGFAIGASRRLVPILVAVALGSVPLGALAQDPGLRFDKLVRDDMFKGLEGDEAALDRAMQVCESRLREDGGDAEALVWHGAGLMIRADGAFLAGAPENGKSLAKRAFAEMAQAVALKPDQVGVLVPRGASLLGAAMRMPESPLRKTYVEIAIGDFEKALELQLAGFAQLAAHPKGELLGALAEAWWLSGKREESQAYLARMTAELPGTSYAAAARVRLDDPAAGRRVTCLGCHAEK